MALLIMGGQPAACSETPRRYEVVVVVRALVGNLDLFGRRPAANVVFST